MRTITRTIIGARLQTLQYFNLPYTHIAHTTLNEKFDIFPEVRPEPGEMPSNRYFCIGNRGHRMAAGSDGYPFTDELQHQPSDGSLFNFIPFVLKRADEDLSPGDRAKYRLRKALTIEGTNYIGYFAKRLDLTGVTPQLINNVVVAGESTTTPFVPSGANLNPTPPNIPPTGSIVTSGDFLSVSTLINLGLNAEDIELLLEVAAIMYGDERQAIVSELALVAGVDAYLTGFGGINYNEVVEAQVTTFITDYHALRFSNNGLILTLDVGAVEPLLVTAEGP